MRIFLAGATGVIGLRLVTELVATGHVVTAMTRSSKGAVVLEELGAEAVLCDVYARQGLVDVVVASRATAVINELTELPDDRSRIAEFSEANARVRTEGTRNLLDAAAAAGISTFLAQSVAWPLGGRGGAATAALEAMVLESGGVVLRYGQFYGPGTYYEEAPPAGPRIEINEAARRTLLALGAPSGVLNIVEEERG